jgi:GNAT superfamily N-acetyltransferase
MSQLTVEPIHPGNLEEVGTLLCARSGTVREYTRWKYHRPGHAGPKGVLARWNGQVVGCFGLVSRTLRLPNGRAVPCSWFADWYVVPTARGTGVGRALLEALSEQAGMIVGHPGPAHAQIICRAAGYRPIAFQVRRRFVLSRWHFERIRTHYATKAVARWSWGAALAAINRTSLLWSSVPPGADMHGAYFDAIEEHARWVREQPVAEHLARTAGTWTSEHLHVEFFDDEASGPGRRLVLYSRGDASRGFLGWRAFLEASKRDGRCFVDAFTTDRTLDRTWRALGGIRKAEPAVLTWGLDHSHAELHLHGWDRENWTYLASSRAEDGLLAARDSAWT